MPGSDDHHHARDAAWRRHVGGRGRATWPPRGNTNVRHFDGGQTPPTQTGDDLTLPVSLPPRHRAFSSIRSFVCPTRDGCGPRPCHTLGPATRKQLIRSQAQRLAAGRPSAPTAQRPWHRRRRRGELERRQRCVALGSANVEAEGWRHPGRRSRVARRLLLRKHLIVAANTDSLYVLAPLRLVAPIIEHRCAAPRIPRLGAGALATAEGTDDGSLRRPARHAATPCCRRPTAPSRTARSRPTR